MKKWSIQVNYTELDMNGKKFRARCIYQIDALDLPNAYEIAEKGCKDKGLIDFTLGAIILGHHSRF